MENNDTGILLNKNNIVRNRAYFKNVCKLKGINVLYRAPRDTTKQYDLHGELQDNIDEQFYEPEVVGCLFNEHTDQKSMKKLGWNAERDETTPVIHVPVELKGLQAGALFIIPSGLDGTQGRVFKVLELSSIAVYPASIACKLGPVLESDFERSQLEDFQHTNFNLLNDEEDEDDEY